MCLFYRHDARGHEAREKRAAIDLRCFRPFDHDLAEIFRERLNLRHVSPLSRTSLMRTASTFPVERIVSASHADCNSIFAPAASAPAHHA